MATPLSPHQYMQDGLVSAPMTDHTPTTPEPDCVVAVDAAMNRRESEALVSFHDGMNDPGMPRMRHYG